MRHYHRKDWQKYRNEIIELDGGVCVKCKRGQLQGAALQVHHKEYLPGKLPWEYPYELCETLCRGCHAVEHGIIRPFSGWECIGYDDLGERVGECELCGNSIRYVFFVCHEKWPCLEVGETCCDHLTETTEAGDQMDSMRRIEARRQRFIQSNRWQPDGTGALWIHQKGADILIQPTENGYRLVINTIKGKLQFPSIEQAKIFSFEIIENGTLESFLKRRIRKNITE
ncbi:HNH endonuclease [Stappia indica]|uniref:HNH endonuclease n=1 Tax=Stappia indica TaxID=538381 RepID=UPI001D184E00|nr:hypothetical protein [Stappia indica]MCC4245673.1 hypothetical protein [Stappia indica]